MQKKNKKQLETDQLQKETKRTENILQWYSRAFQGQAVLVTNLFIAAISG